MKDWIRVSTGDISTVYEKLMLHHTQQRAQISRDTAYQKARVLLKLQPKFWSDVAKKVPHPALKEASRQYQLAQALPADAPPCTGTFTKVMGIPCAHAIKQKLASKEQVRVYDFRSHWCFNKHPSK
uniref:Uncharacterized protein n=1 Tax=Hyaloperonospora arabidopsidis (strain Emoy2) TaxID=559515 RepID=M4BNK2_HYAAE